MWRRFLLERNAADRARAPKSVTAAAIDGLGWALARLPEMAQRGGSQLLSAVLQSAEARHPVMHETLVEALPALARHDVTRLLQAHLYRRAAGVFGFVEALWGRPACILDKASVTGWPQLVQYQRQGVAVILIAGHFIDLPAGVRALAERVPVQLVARLFRHPAFRRPVARLAQRTGGCLIDGGNPKAIVRALQRGGTVLILADYPLDQSLQSAPAAERIARLAQWTGAVVLPVGCRREGGRPHLEIGAPLPLESTGDAALQGLYQNWIEAARIDYLWPRRIRRP